MSTGTRSRSTETAEQTRSSRPSISACEGSPGKVVFIESGNTDGWIATDRAVVPSR